jgi:hypothetical protein
MKTLFVLLGCALLLLTHPAQPQEPKHEPTVAQCRADVEAWASLDLMKEYDYTEEKFRRDGTPNTSQVSKASFKELTARAVEMNHCEGIDVDRHRDYPQSRDWLELVERDRLMNFLVRHKLTAKFYAEDEAGVR